MVDADAGTAEPEPPEAVGEPTLERAHPGIRAAIEFDKKGGPQEPLLLSEDTETADFLKTVGERLSDLVDSEYDARWQQLQDEPAAGEASAATDSTWPQSAFKATGGNPAQVALLVAIGALSGLDSGQIQDASARLCERFIARAPQVAPGEGAFVLDISTFRDDLLRNFEAEVLPAAKGLAERLTFRPPHDGAAVVKQAVSQFGPQIRQDVLAWLGEAGSARDSRARTAIGRVCGAVAEHDFASLEIAVFEAWRTASTERPLIALDAAFTTLSRRGGGAAVKQAVGQMSRRADYDDLFALAALATGVFGEENPETAFTILARLLQLGDTFALALAVRGYRCWLDRGKRNPALAGRVFREIDAIANDGSDRQRIHKAWMVLAILDQARHGDVGKLAIFEANMASPDALAAFGRLLNYVVFFADARTKGPPIRMDARLTARALFRAGLGDADIRRVSTPLFKAALEQATPEQVVRLRELIGLWRSKGPLKPKGQDGRSITSRRDEITQRDAS